MRYHFSDFTLDTDQYELTCNGELVHLEPQAMALLVLLITENSRILTKEEIHQEIWKNRVVTDAALSSRIKMIRQALGDDGRSQKFIRTVSKRGFRFVAEVRELDASDAGETEGKQKSDSGIQHARTLDLTESRPSVAVLPFTNISGDIEQEYFSDGVTEDIITALSKFRWFFVIARNSVFVYKGKAVDIKQVGDELGVRYVLEGSIRKSVDRVRITAQLIEAETGNHVWAERYDRELKDIFELQDEITSTIAAAVEPELAGSERHRAMRKPTDNLGAWDLFHHGVTEMWKQDRELIIQGMNIIRQATKLDSNFGQAYGYLALGSFFLLVYDWVENVDDELRQGLEDGNRAVTLDQRDYFAFHALGRLHTLAGDHRAAVRALETCLNINPYFALGHVGLGEAHVYGGEPELAIKYLDEAIELSPNDPFKWDMYHYKACAYIRMDDRDRAIENFEKACEFPTVQFPPYATLAALYVMQGKETEGIKALERSRQLDSGVSIERMKTIYGMTDERPGSRSQMMIDALRSIGLCESVA